MDDIKTPKSSRAKVASPTRRVFGAHNAGHVRRHTKTPSTGQASKSDSFSLDEYVRAIKKRRRKDLLKFLQKARPLAATTKRRVICAVAVTVLILAAVFPILQEKLDHKIYALSPGEKLVLPRTSKNMADKLKLDGQKQSYMFNQDYKPVDPSKEISAGGAFIQAQIDQDPTKGIKVTDPVNKVDFTVKPSFKLGTGKQDENRIVFPAFNGGGHLVYTAGAVGVKQDVTLDHYIGDKLKYSYDLDLGDTYAARLEKNGAVGIYGSSLPLNGNVSTGNDKDAALLKKARQAAVKDKLLFELPAPKIKETNNHLSDAKAVYELKGNKLNVVVKNLKHASYPLTIDPTVTAVSGLGGNGLFSFDANIETNVYLDPTNNFFQRSALTGGNLQSWVTASGTPASSHFLGAAVVYAGTLYLIGGSSGTTTNISNGANSHLIEQAKIKSDGTIDTFTDGNYSGLPSGGLARFQVLTYNGYIYLIDGINGFTSIAAGGTFTNTNNVYYTRITSESFGAFTNGAQLKNWGTTTNKPATQVYAYGATVYNGTIYVAGGLNSSGTAVSTVLYSNILPSGDLGTFNTATSLPAARFGMDMQAYNGHLYILGGNTGTLASAALTASTLYASIASDGSIADSSWKTGTNLVSSNGASNQAMENFGAQFSMIYNGYLYITGGCTSVTSGTCTNAGSVASYSQLAQINADGSLGTFFPNDFSSAGNPTLQRAATPTFGYNGFMYSVGGCSQMSGSTVSCTTNISTSSYTAVNTAVGDISANRNPTGLPANLYGHAMVVLNGYLYVIGGCLNNACTGNRSANYTTYYALINNDGSLGAFNNNTNPQTARSPLNWDGQVTPGFFGQVADCSAGGADQCGLTGMAVATYNGYIYAFAGNDGNANSRNVYYMQPSASNGQQGLWTTVTNALPTAITEAGAVAHNGALYVIAGCTAAAGNGIGCTAYQDAVYKSNIGAAGAPGAFATTNQLQFAAGFGMGASGVSFYGGYIYIAGGAGNYAAGGGYYGNAGQTTDVLRAKIDASGNIVNVNTGLSTGGWTLTTGHLGQARRRTNSQVINGYLYVIGGHNACDPSCGGNGTTYGDVQIGQLDLSTGGTGDIASFTASATSTLTPRWNAGVAFGSGFMYVTGGCATGPPPAACSSNGAGTSDQIDESFVVYNANNLGVNTWNASSHTYSASSPDPALSNRLGAGAAVYNGYLYIAGGCTTFTIATLACSAAIDTTSFAAINADGTLGTWSGSSPNLPAIRAFGQLVAQNGNLYFIGGQASGGISDAKNNVYKSVIGAAGLPGSFSSAGQTVLPENLTQMSAVAYAGFIFVAGGYNATNSLNRTTVYHSTINGAGSITAWTATTAGFTTARRELSLVSAGAFLYIIGGFDGTNYYADVQQATPNTSTGDITSWTKVREIPYAQAGMSGFGSNGYIYLFGGRNGNVSTSCSNNTNFAAVNGNGTVGDWQQTPNQLASTRFGTAAGFSNGYLYVSGGHDCTNIVSSNVIQQSGQLSEAIHATYTRYVDFGTDATFRQLYVLGTNAVISGTDIDKWKIIVKTSTSANNSWGQKSNFSLTGLGTGPAYGSPITFQALDGSGVDQGASQFLSITFDIDQSQSFNFPDAATPPQITKYDFYFSPGPGKRLRNGKTFINNQQTTLDAHP